MSSRWRRPNAPIWLVAIIMGVSYALISVYVTHAIRRHGHHSVLGQAIFAGVFFGVTMGAYFWWRKRHYEGD